MKNDPTIVFAAHRREFDGSDISYLTTDVSNEADPAFCGILMSSEDPYVSEDANHSLSDAGTPVCSLRNCFKYISYAEYPTTRPWSNIDLLDIDQYYERDFNDNTQSKFEHKSTLQNFGSNCPKFLTFNKSSEHVGPGAYFKKKNKFEIQKHNNILLYFSDNTKVRHICIDNNIRRKKKMMMTPLP